MERVLKQRLVGAAVVVALVVIFVPMLLHNPHGRGRWFGSPRVPPRPAWDLKAPADLAQAPQMAPSVSTPPARLIVSGTAGGVPPASSATAAPAHPAPSPAAAPVPAQVPSPPPASATGGAQPTVPPTPATAAPTGLHSWVVQLASLTSEANALALRDRLRKRGYTTFVERVRIGRQSVYRVRVGPELDRARAEALRQRLQTQQKLSGIVLSYP